MEKIFFHSHVDKLPVLITLSTNKVYVGWVLELPSCYPFQTKRHVKIIPIASGFRDDKNLKLTVTQKYPFLIKIPSALKEALEGHEESKSDNKTRMLKLKPDQKVTVKSGEQSIEIEARTLTSIYEQGLIVDVDEIVSATIWSEEIYKLFSDNSEDNKPVENNSMIRTDAPENDQSAAVGNK